MKTIRVWFVGLMALGLLAAQVLPVSAMNLEITFTTEAAPPNFYVTGITPDAGSAGVALNTTIAVHYFVQGGKINPADFVSRIQLYKVQAGGDIVVPWGLTASEYSGDDQVGSIFTPTSPLEANSDYYVGMPCFNSPAVNIYTDNSYATVAATFATHQSFAPMNAFWDGSVNLFKYRFSTLITLGAVSANFGNGAVDPTIQHPGISINAHINILMNMALDPNTVDATHVVLHKGLGTSTTLVGATVLLNVSSNDNKTITIIPDAPLEYSTNYTLVLTGVQALP